MALANEEAELGEPALISHFQPLTSLADESPISLSFFPLLFALALLVYKNSQDFFFVSALSLNLHLPQSHC